MNGPPTNSKVVHSPFRVMILNGAIRKIYVRGKPTASSLSPDEFPLMAGPNFQSDGNPTVISILLQLADGPKNNPTDN